MMKRVRLLKHRERQEEMKKDFGEYLSEDGEAEEDEWALRLDVDSKGRCLPTINNAKIILANDRALKGKIRKNEFTKKIQGIWRNPMGKREKGKRLDRCGRCRTAALHGEDLPNQRKIYD